MFLVLMYHSEVVSISVLNKRAIIVYRHLVYYFELQICDEFII